MKSSSSSPSSSPYIYSQRRSRSIFSMLRRILCLPTQDHTSSSSSAAKDDDSSIVTMMMMMKEEEEKTVPGGLVARLMGLDSMPDKITRSRSLNYVDHHKVQNEPKRTRSKSSTYIELLDTEDDKFIVLSFHNRPQNKTISARNYDAEACNQENSSSNKQIRLVKKKKTENSSSDSEESSPISVFDFQQSQQGSETATPTSDDDSWTRSSNSSRVSIYSSTEQDNTIISIDQQKPPALLNKKTKAVVVNGQKKNREMWGRVCDITVADINKGTASDWVDKDLAAEFEVHIMDQLFNELLLH